MSTGMGNQRQAAQTAKSRARPSLAQDGDEFSKERKAAIWEALKYFRTQLDLSDRQLAKFIRVSTSAVNKWINNQTLPSPESNDYERLIHLLAIHRNMEAMFEEPETQQEWVDTFRPDLGKKPKELMEGTFRDVLALRSYLDFVRGRGA